jgi:hypothetical protein
VVQSPELLEHVGNGRLVLLADGPAKLLGGVGHLADLGAELPHVARRHRTAAGTAIAAATAELRRAERVPLAAAAILRTIPLVLPTLAALALLSALALLTGLSLLALLPLLPLLASLLTLLSLLALLSLLSLLTRLATGVLLA